MRASSPTFGKSFGVELSADNRLQLWVPAGFAHGFLVLSDSADFLYKTTDYYHPQSERTLMWSDPQLGIDWPLGGVQGDLVISDKDRRGVALADCETYP